MEKVQHAVRVSNNDFVEYLSCEYRQTIVDNNDTNIHEEIGMFIFNLKKATVTRHGVIPHGAKLGNRSNTQVQLL